MLLAMVLICIWSDYFGGEEMKEEKNCFSGKGQGMKVPDSNDNSDINWSCDFWQAIYSLGSYFLICQLKMTVFTLPMPQECYQIQLKHVSEDVEKYNALNGLN